MLHSGPDLVYHGDVQEFSLSCGEKNPKPYRGHNPEGIKGNLKQRLSEEEHKRRMQLTSKIDQISISIG